jgi:hypothetical protein
VGTAFRFRARGEVAVDAFQKCIESAVANDFANHLGTHGNEMLEELSAGFVVVNKEV